PRRKRITHFFFCKIRRRTSEKVNTKKETLETVRKSKPNPESAKTRKRILNTKYQAGKNRHYQNQISRKVVVPRECRSYSTESRYSKGNSLCKLFITCQICGETQEFLP